MIIGVFVPAQGSNIPKFEATVAKNIMQEAVLAVLFGTL
jgi:hypothetical protein